MVAINVCNIIVSNFDDIVADQAIANCSVRKLYAFKIKTF